MGWIGNKNIYSVKSPVNEKDRLIITDARTLATKQTLAGDIANLTRRSSFIAEFDASPLTTTFTNPLFAELELDEIQAFDKNGVDVLRKPEASKPSVGQAGADTITYDNGFFGKYLFVLSVTGNAFVELARKWAINPEDEPVTENPDEFSALHWAEKTKQIRNEIIQIISDFEIVGSSVTKGENYTIDLIKNNGDVIPIEFSQSFRHMQSINSNQWEIAHNLGYKPSVTVVDLDGNIINGDVSYDTSNQLTLTFAEPLKGEAYLN